MWLMESVTKEVRNACTTPVGNRQPELFARSKRPAISLPEIIRWWLDATVTGPRWRCGPRDSREEAEERGGAATAVASDAWGADVDGDSENALPRGGGAIRYYAPARLSVGLTETDLDAGLHDDPDFAQLLGEDGCRLINERW